jgi:hypothetical protein
MSTETYLYFSDPTDLDWIREQLSLRLRSTSSSDDCFFDDRVTVWLEHGNGDYLVEEDVWSTEGPYLDETACWARLRIFAYNSPGASEASNALLPIMWFADSLDFLGKGFRWFDPFSMNTNEGLDFLDIIRYHEDAEWKATQGV